MTGIEVTQAIQTPTNSIVLVAERGTAVRVTVGTGGGGGVSGVTGTLRVFVGGTEVTPAGGVPPINSPFTAPAAPLRENEDDTLNFELPAPTGIAASADVDVRVELDALAGETDTGNNSGSVDDLTFEDRTTPLLYYTSIDYTPAGLGLPDTAQIQPGTGDAFVRGILPVNDADPVLYRQGLFPSLPFAGDADGDGRLDALGADGNDLLSLLATCRQLIVDSGVGASDRIFLYGWLAGNPIDGNGLAQVGGRNAFGNSDSIRGQRSYAHELTHNFGLNHNTRTLDEVGWDVGARLVDNPTGNNTTGRVKPTTFFDIQNAGRLTNEAWIDTGNYGFLLNAPTLTTSPDEAAGDLFRRVLVIQGIFDPDGERLLRLEPALRFPWLSMPTLVDDGRFVAEVTDDAGVVSRVRFDALIADDPRREIEVNGFFEVMVMVDPRREVTFLRILDAASGRELGSLERSEPPEITVVAPAEGGSLGRRTEVAWEVRDQDTPDDELTFQISYSPDGGESWVPVAVDIPGAQMSVVFDSARIEATDGQGVIRVFVSDGLNTAFDDVGGLTTEAAIFPP